MLFKEIKKLRENIAFIYIKEQKKDILDYEIVVYTDCQNIISLKTRKERLEKNNYHSSTGKLISSQS